MPFKRFLPDLSFLSDKIDFKNGTNNENFNLGKKFNFIPLICYEIIFSKYIFDQIDNKTALIINITNDGWFGDSIGPYQHLQFAKIRAVEFGIPVARVANTGISAFIDPYGEISSQIGINQRGFKTNVLIEKLETTLFKLWGNNIFIFILIYVCFVNMFIFTKRGKIK